VLLRGSVGSVDSFLLLPAWLWRLQFFEWRGLITPGRKREPKTDRSWSRRQQRRKQTQIRRKFPPQVVRSVPFRSIIFRCCETQPTAIPRRLAIEKSSFHRMSAKD